MSASLLELLPQIVADGRRVAERILEGIEGRRNLVMLQTREVVLPSRDSARPDWVMQQAREGRQDAFATGAATPVVDGAPAPAPPWINRLIYGDNLLAIAALLAGDETTPSLRGKVDLIYIDPPFDSKADYRTKVRLPGGELEQRPTVIEQFAYSDTWSDGTASYLRMIVPQLVLMRELLSDTGSLFVHLDWHVGHYVKIALDEVFGRKNFRNELIWYYYNKMPDTRNKLFPRSHDVIYWYAKNERSGYHFAHQEEKRDKAVKQLVRKKVDGRMVNARDEQGNVQYVERDARTVDSVWRLSMLQPADKTENQGYLTQKPETLLERILRSATRPGDLVADFNGGAGTTAAVAERLGRRWITSDLGKPACMIMRKRLIDQEAQPFLYQAIGDYQIESAKATLGRDFRLGDLATIVMQLFGALPLPAEFNPSRNLGEIAGFDIGGRRASKTLVLADSPNKLTGLATLKKAQVFRDNLLGGFERVVVLGWNFEPAIGEEITALNDKRLEVLVVPSDLLDRLKKKGDVDRLRHQIRFASMQYLTIHPVQVQRSGESDTLSVQLRNYVMLSPDAMPLDDEYRETVRELVNKEPLALIEYWAVDPDYDGKVFRSVWQDYRGNTANDADALRVVTRATLTVPAKAGRRQVCVRVVDVFGFEAEALGTVGQA